MFISHEDPSPLVELICSSTYYRPNECVTRWLFYKVVGKCVVNDLKNDSFFFHGL